jgi:hypothetical protein
MNKNADGLTISIWRTASWAILRHRLCSLKRSSMITNKFYLILTKNKLLSFKSWLWRNSILNKMFLLISLIVRNTSSLKSLYCKIRGFFTVNSASLIGKNMKFKMLCSFIRKMRIHLNFWLINKEVKSSKFKLFS